MATTAPEKKMLFDDTAELKSPAQYFTFQKTEALHSKTREYYYDQSNMYDSASSQKRTQGNLQTNFLDAALLSRLDMPAFSGNLLDFPTFWSRYNALVHSKMDLSDATKFSLLKSCLKGQALQTIEGIPVTDEDYRTAVDILHQMYDNPSALRHLIYTELANLPRCDQEGKRLQETYLKMLRLIRQYTSITPGSPEYGLGALLYNKLPRFVQSKIYTTGGQMSLTPNQLMDLLSDVVRKEVTLRQVANSINSYSANNYNFRTSTAEDAGWTKKPKSPTNVRQKSCPFCSESSHNAFQCTNFNSPDERRDRTHQNDLCFKCLRPDHRTKSCDRPPCNICSHQHHPSLCYHSRPLQNKTLSERNANNFIQNNSAFPKNLTKDWSRGTKDAQCNSNRFPDDRRVKQSCSPVNLVNFSEDTTENNTENENEEDREPKQKDKLCYTTTSPAPAEAEDNEQRKSNHEILLMCTEIILVNPDDKNKRVKSLAFLDSGSTHSYIRTNVAEDLELSQVTEKYITLHTFGKEESQTILSKQYNICILLPNDSLYPMKVQSLPILTKPLPLPNSLPSLPNEFTHNFSVSARRRETGLLIGMDRFWQLILSSDFHSSTLPSGHYLLNTKLGEIISGREIPIRAVIMAVKDETNHPLNKQSLDEMVERFWTCESLGTSNEASSRDDSICLDSFNNTTRYDKAECRYYTRLPFRSRPPNVPENYNHSLACLKSNWKTLSKENLMTLQFQRVPFGLICSAFLLAATIHLHLTKMDTSLSNEILTSCYVDNIFLSAKTKEHAIDKYNEAKNLFKLAGMNVRQWTTSSAEANKIIATKEDAPAEKTANIFGIQWKVESDKLTLRLPRLDEKSSVPTKRKVLKRVAPIFDPLGLIASSTVEAKIFLQSLWKENLQWNEMLPTASQHIWRNILSSWTIPSIVIPRRPLRDSEAPSSHQLHVFTDASQSAYCAVAHIRTVTAQQIVIVHDSIKPRSQWKLGRIIKKSDHCATLKLADGQSITRPLNLLHPLEIPASERNIENDEEEITMLRDTDLNKKQQDSKTEQSKKQQVPKKTLQRTHPMVTRSLKRNVV